MSQQSCHEPAEHRLVQHPELLRGPAWGGRSSHSGTAGRKTALVTAFWWEGKGENREKIKDGETRWRYY